jgi:hypothetical protein
MGVARPPPRRDFSWNSLLLHLKKEDAAVDDNEQLATDVAIVPQAWSAIRRFQLSRTR